MRIGILGGTFNPVHNGHLLIADKVKSKLKLDRVIFIVSGNPPHKEIKKVKAKDRLKMTSLAVKDNPSFKVSKIERNRSKSR